MGISKIISNSEVLAFYVDVLSYFEHFYTYFEVGSNAFCTREERQLAGPHCVVLQLRR